MATVIPTPLRSADIARFVQRAGQVEKAKPVIAYWCMCNQSTIEAEANSYAGNYWIVNQILSKGLHNTDDECMTFTMNLMDKLEQVRHSLEASIKSSETDICVRPKAITPRTTRS